MTMVAAGAVNHQRHNPGCRFSVSFADPCVATGALMVHVLGLDSKTRLISPCGRTKKRTPLSE